MTAPREPLESLSDGDVYDAADERRADEAQDRADANWDARWER